MKNTLLFIFSALLLPPFATAQLPAVSTGKIIRHENFRSAYVKERNVDVWIPDGYPAAKKYAVLYMHDGQMLFDSTVTWNRQAWDVDDVTGKLLKEKKIRDVIVVGIWNTGATRHMDYFPQKPFEALTKRAQDSLFNANRASGQAVFAEARIQSDAYLKFLATELKPFIDSAYSTHPDRKNTFIAGSSMGGLISLYAICEYPAVFGGAACLSTHWPGVFMMENNPIPEQFFNYLEKNLPDPADHRIYFDYGTETLDALYPPLQKKVDGIMRAHGFTKKNWMTREFPGEDHSERAWNKRLEVPLIFLLKK